jgi:predicted dehydrogenase
MTLPPARHPNTNAIMKIPLTRRSFLGSTLTAAVALPWMGAGALGAAASERKLRLGLIGCGWYGMVCVNAAFKSGGVEVIALCDPDSAHLEANAVKIEELQGHRPRLFRHHAELLELSSLDAVIIASPPQWHALQFIDALNRGLDIYCEKPLAYDVREGRAMVDAARKSGRVVQIGLQRRQSPAIRQVREHIRNGHAGQIVQVEAQIHYTAGMRDATPQPPPASLDWDLWCGPSPKLPYSPQIGHFAWRLEKETGHGHLVDWGIHLIDATRFILGESAPRAVTAAGGIYRFKDQITTPDILTAHFEFDTCPVIWRHRIWGAEEFAPETNNGIFFYGDKQTLFVTDDRWITIPRGKGKERQVHQVSGDLATLHMTEFLHAVRTRAQPHCTPEEGHLSTSAVKLAMIAYDTGATIHWDGAAEQVRDHPAANRLLRREYRAPWKHPYQA